MDRRLELQTILEGLDPALSVYFQPPSGYQMQYPCVVYARDRKDEKFADNVMYLSTKCYRVVIMDRDPDSVIPDKVAQLPLTSFVTHYKVDQVNHDIYNVYY